MTAHGRRRADDLPAVEGMRALAAVGIVSYHLWQNGYRVVDGRAVHAFSGSRLGMTLVYALTAGVPVFFALSGFLLARPFLRSALLGNGLPDMRDWARRRAFRVLPLYVLLVVGIWGSRNFRWPGDWRDLLEHLTFTQDLDQKRIFYTLGPGWSMASEVKFYVLLALLAVVWVRSTRRLRSHTGRLVVLAVPIVALYGLSMAVKWWVFVHDGVSGYQYTWSYSFPVRLDGFCVGMAVALWSAHREVRGARPWRRWTSSLSAVTVAGVVYGGYLRGGGTEGTGVWVYPLMAVSAAPLLVVLVACRDGIVSRALSWRPLVQVGLMTYSLYLVHEPVLEQLSHWGLVDGRQHLFALQLLVLLAASLLVAVVCHYGIERPGLQLLNLWDRGRPREYYPHLVGSPEPYPADRRALVTVATR